MKNINLEMHTILEQMEEEMDENESQRNNSPSELLDGILVSTSTSNTKEKNITSISKISKSDLISGDGINLLHQGLTAIQSKNIIVSCTFCSVIAEWLIGNAEHYTSTCTSGTIKTTRYSLLPLEHETTNKRKRTSPLHVLLHEASHVPSPIKDFYDEDYKQTTQGCKKRHYL